LSKFAGLSLECVAAQAHAEVGKALGRALRNKMPAHCLSIEDQMRLLHESQMTSSASECHPLHIQLQLLQSKVFSASVVGSEILGDLDVISARRSDGTLCYLHLPPQFTSLCAELITPGRSVRWIARASPPLTPDTCTPLHTPGELLALVIKPLASEGDALLAELLSAGDLGSACVATVIQVMEPQQCSKYRATLVRVLLYVHNCFSCDGRMRSDHRGILLLWDRQHGIAALFEEGDTLLLQSPIWVSSYDADDIADWGCGTENPILLEVGPQSVLFIHQAELQPADLYLRAASLQQFSPENEHSLDPPRSLPISLHSCTSANITDHALRAPVAIAAATTHAAAAVCPRIEALELTFVHALPLPMLLCDAAAGMRGLCCMVHIVSFELVRAESSVNLQASMGRAECQVIRQGQGRGSDMSVVRCQACPKDAACCNGFAMYIVSDGWGTCNLLLPLVTHNPSQLLHKTVLLHGFDCRELVLFGGSSGCNDRAVELNRRIILMPHKFCRVLPVTLNIGLALSAAHHETLPSIMPIVATLKTMVAARSASHTWSPSHAVATILLSVLDGVGATGCSVVLQDTIGCVIQLPCSISLPQLQAAQLLPLVGASVVCILALERVREDVQVEGIYRC